MTAGNDSGRLVVKLSQGTANNKHPDEALKTFRTQECPHGPKCSLHKKYDSCWHYHGKEDPEKMPAASKTITDIEGEANDAFQESSPTFFLTKRHEKDRFSRAV